MINKLLVLTFIATFIFACGGEEKTASTSTTKAKKEVIAAIDGKAIYQTNCVACHGVNGDMGVSGAANLAESQLSLEERIHVLENGREGTAMVSYKSLLEEDEIKAVAEYTIKLQEK